MRQYCTAPHRRWPLAAALALLALASLPACQPEGPLCLLGQGACFEPADKADDALPQAEEGYTLTVLSQQPGLIQLELRLKEVTLSTTEVEGVLYHQLEVADSGVLPEVGRPRLPVFSPMLGVPPTTVAAWVEAVAIDPADRQTLEGIHLLPVQAPLLEDDPPADFARDDSVYAQDAWYPGPALNEQPLTLATWRNVRVVRGTLAPFQYNPARGELELIKRLTITLGYLEDPTLTGETVDSGRAGFAAAYDRALINGYEVLDSAAAPAASETEYLMLVVDRLLPALQPLIAHKAAAGSPPAVVLTSELTVEGEYRPRPERIKETIRSYFEQQGVSYALLVGDVDDLPMYSWEGKPSDIWYGCLRGEDPLPEVLIGRLSGKTPEQLAAHVQKIVAYTQESAGPADWKERILLVSHGEDAPKKYTANSEAVRQRGYLAHSYQFASLQGSEQGQNSAILDAVNQGVALLSYRGHGTKEAWSEWNGGDFGPAEVAQLQNARLPIVLSVACWNLGLQSFMPTLAEAWVQQPGGGAVAFLGATRPSYTKQNDDFHRHLFWSLLSGRAPDLGALLLQASARLYRQYGDDPAALTNLRIYAWLGDPATPLGSTFYTLPPLSPSGVLINEVLANPPAGPVGDANGDGTRHFAEDEFVEIVNASGQAQDLSGYTIADDLQVRFTFPAGTTLPPGEAALVFGGGAPSGFAAQPGLQLFVSPRALQLNNDGDTVTLANAAGTKLDRLQYGRALAAGGSMTRALDGDPQAPFVQHPGPALFSPGTRADGQAFGD